MLYIIDCSVYLKTNLNLAYSIKMCVNVLEGVGINIGTNKN